LARPTHAEWLTWYRRLLTVRREAIVPHISGIRAGGGYEVLGEGAVAIRWALCRGTLLLAANLSGAAVAGFPAASGHLLWQEGAVDTEGRSSPWTVRWSIEQAPVQNAVEGPQSLGARGETVRAEAKRGHPGNGGCGGW
jgi:maltooligosyltrehalose trehalohydrolase